MASGEDERGCAPSPDAHQNPEIRQVSLPICEALYGLKI